MSVVTMLAIYAISWWLTLFAVLPLGVRSQSETGTVTPGTESAAPERPRMLYKVGLTTLLALPVALILGWFIQYADQIF